MPGAVSYMRVSTAEQASGNNSLPVQKKKLRDYCKTQNLERENELFVDPGESARTTRVSANASLLPQASPGSVARPGR
jgi:DNA invertase Pin-like site-specific DNA recombinase